MGFGARIIGGMLAAMVLAHPLAATAATSENRHGVAVIVGNKDYRTPDVPDVSFAHRDADAIKRYVTGTLGFRERNVIDLRDATQAQIERAFGNERSYKGELWRLLREGKSDVVVFYSGHGMPGLKDGESYLMRVDVRATDVEISGYPLRVLYDNLRKLRARSVLVLIDACFSGGSHGGTLMPAGSGMTVSERKVTDVPTELTVLTAAGPREISSWDLDAKHGLFTSYFLRGVAGAADGKGYGDGNRSVTIGEIKRYLDDEMTYAAKRRFGREQSVTVRGNGKVVLATYTPGEVRSPPATSTVDHAAVEAKLGLRR